MKKLAMKRTWTRPKPQTTRNIPDAFFRELDIQLLIHELKDPTGILITVLRSLLDKQEKYGPLSPRQEKALKRASQAVLQLQNMLNDLLEIGRSEARQFAISTFQPKETVYTCLLNAIKTTDSDLFEQSLEYEQAEELFMFFSRAGIDVRMPPEMDTCEIVQDETKFRQIVRNLLKNALRFRNKRMEVRLYQEGEYLYVEIEDDGPGIRPKDHDIIFHRYTQVKRGTSFERKGHGLGLAGALIQAKRLGGDITVRSYAGKGATFCLVVPVELVGNMTT